jgi:hypothetical protein
MYKIGSKIGWYGACSYQTDFGWGDPHLVYSGLVRLAVRSQMGHFDSPAVNTN